MTIAYTNCKTVINKGTYGTREEILEKLDVFLLNNRVSRDEYDELVALVNDRE